MSNTQERTYEDLMAQVQQLAKEGKVDVWPSREQRIDWAYGNTKIENEAITREMVAAAVDAKPSPHR